MITTTASPTGTPAGGTGVNDPVPGQVFQVAVDMDTTGNPAGSGGLLSSIQANASVSVGNTHEIDVIVDEVDPSDGMSGFSFNLKFDPTVITITAKNFNSYMLPGGFEIAPPPIPNTSGNLRMDVAQILGNVSGEGVLVRFEIECIADGTSPLNLDDDIGGDGLTSLTDALLFGVHWLTISGQDADYSARFDLNGDGTIGVADVLSLGPFFLQFCNAPTSTPTPSP